MKNNTLHHLEKPVLQTATAHPRLVTAKLTATPQPSSAGWSRPSSAVSAGTPAPLSTTNQKTVPGTVPGAGVVPVPPPGGKVIHPQPRAGQDTLPAKRDASAKPAWGNTKGSSAPATRSGVQSEFPTAAEVAQSTCSFTRYCRLAHI